MSNSEIIDNFFEEEKKIILFSKLSIFLICIILSPYWAGFLYCANLRYTGQTKKIFSTYFSIAMFDFLALVPLLGIDLSIHGFNYNFIFLISKTIVGLLIVFPLWEKQLKEVEYHSIFPWARIFAMIVLYFLFVAYHMSLDNQFSYYGSRPWYILSFNSITIPPILLFIVIGKIIYTLGLSLLKKIKK